MMNTPIIHPDTLSAVDLFGSATRLVQGNVPATVARSVADNGVFQAMALVLILLYMLFLVRHADIIRSMVASTMGGTASRRISRKPVNLSDRRNLSLALSATGIIIVAMTVIRLTDNCSGSTASVLGDGIWCPFGIIVAVLALFALAEYALLRLIGFISNRRDICESVVRMKLLHFSTAVLVILPVATLYIFSPERLSFVWLGVLALQSAVSVILFLKWSLSLFISQRVSILYWILYLCGVELLPASLLLAPVLRGSAGV